MFYLLYNNIYFLVTLFNSPLCRLAIILCCCFSISLAQVPLVLEPELATTASSLDVTTYTGTYSPTPPDFDFMECKNSMDTLDQVIYICIQNRPLFYILQYAESLAKRKCEEEFSDNLWNCSGFSILKEPKLSKNGMSMRVCTSINFVGIFWVRARVSWENWERG